MGTRLALEDAAAARRLERIAAFGLYGMLVAPAALCLVTSPAVALPAGAGMAAAVALAAAGWLSNDSRKPVAVAEAAPEDDLAAPPKTRFSIFSPVWSPFTMSAAS